MSYILRSQIGGWGAVRNPLDEDEMIPVDDGEIVVDDEELARAILDENDALYLADEPDEEPDESEETDDEELPIDPSESSVSDIHEWVVSVDDVDDIEAVADAERDSKDRSSAIERLEQRQSAIEDED